MSSCARCTNSFIFLSIKLLFNTDKQKIFKRSKIIRAFSIIALGQCINGSPFHVLAVHAHQGAVRFMANFKFAYTEMRLIKCTLPGCLRGMEFISTLFPCALSVFSADPVANATETGDTRGIYQSILNGVILYIGANLNDVV